MDNISKLASYQDGFPSDWIDGQRWWEKFNKENVSATGRVASFHKKSPLPSGLYEFSKGIEMRMPVKAKYQFRVTEMETLIFMLDRSF